MTTPSARGARDDLAGYRFPCVWCGALCEEPGECVHQECMDALRTAADAMPEADALEVMPEGWGQV